MPETGNYDINIITPEHVIQSMNTSLQVLLNDPKVQIAGIILIIDFDLFSLYHQAKLISFTSIWVSVNLFQVNIYSNLKFNSFFVNRKMLFVGK